jgi:hypothetical protein
VAKRIHPGRVTCRRQIGGDDVDVDGDDVDGDFAQTEVDVAPVAGGAAVGAAVLLE